MLDADTQVRYSVIIGLNKLGDLHPTWSLDRRLVETVLGAEIMGHLRSYQILGTLGREMSDPEPVTEAIHEAMEGELERIFRLMKLLFPHQDLHSAYVGVQSRNPVVHDNALEFLENILGPQLRSLLLPLLDSEVPMTVADRSSRIACSAPRWPTVPRRCSRSSPARIPGSGRAPPTRSAR